ncbi:MAG: cob(I)yrinic acid a,c-diamide adenosyltransferase [Candidatus Magnetomorum sp.]|nr:cob(I)yrinic acid a,c-diamide adenosyltransferase [Candidatus Magnetomorum sp.]
MQKGFLSINTGTGKGKTTAALGQVLRALGHDKRVCMIQFIKGSWQYGELFSVRRFSDLLDFHVMGKGFTFLSDNLDEDRRIAQEGWALADKALTSKDYFMLVLDEFTYLLKYQFLEIATVITALNNRRPDLHVVITGRDAPQALIDMSDLVTEMKEIKHPYHSGVKARKGIEF